MFDYKCRLLCSALSILLIRAGKLIVKRLRSQFKHPCDLIPIHLKYHCGTFKSVFALPLGQSAAVTRRYDSQTVLDRVKKYSIYIQTEVLG